VSDALDARADYFFLASLELAWFAAPD